MHLRDPWDVLFSGFINVRKVLCAAAKEFGSGKGLASALVLAFYLHTWLRPRAFRHLFLLIYALSSIKYMMENNK